MGDAGHSYELRTSPCLRAREQARCRRVRHGVTRLAALLVLIVSAAEARAQDGAGAVPPRTSSLSWVRLPGAEGCIGTHALASAVETRLRRTVFVSASAADVSVEGRVERTSSPRGWRAVVAMSDAHGAALGERTLESAEPSCGALDEPLALVVAVMIDPDAALAPAPPAVPAPPPTAAPPAPREPEPRVVVRTRRVVVRERAPAARWRFDLLGRVAVAAGYMPGISPGLSGASVVEPPGFLPIELELALFPTATARSSDGAFEARLGLLVAGALLCAPTLGGERLRAQGCAGLEAGVLQARGVGADVSLEDERAVVQLAARARAILRVVGPFVVQASASLVVPLRRDRFVVRDADGAAHAIFEPAPVGGTFDLGAGLSFP